MTQTTTTLVTVGRAELMSLLDSPDVLIVPAKIDTGAYRSAIHADEIRLSEDGKTLHFNLLADHPVCGNASFETSTQDFKTVTIENSFGHREERYEVKVRVSFAGKNFKASFSLADRSKKVYPVLIGRRLLNRRYLVDTNQSSVDRALLKQEFGVDFPNDEEGGEA